MNLWTEAFEIWKNHCPFVKRELISKSNFVKWAKELNLLKTFEEDDFFLFIEFLEEAEIICPLAYSSENQRLPIKNNFSNTKNNDHDLELYHPIQFFDVLNWLKDTSYKGSPYYFNKNFRDYFFLKKHQFKINKTKKNIEYSQKNGWDTNYFEEHLEKLELELNSFQNVYYVYPIGSDLLRSMKIGGTSRILTETFLCLWIKIESLLYQKDATFYGKYIPGMRLTVDDPWDKDQVKDHIEKYREWRDEELNQTQTGYLNEEERGILKKWHFNLNHKIGTGNFGPFGTNGNWIDLFDVINESNVSEISGMISYYINLMFIRRYLERTYWNLYEKNIVYDREEDTKPYFVCKTKEEWDTYLKGVKVEFGLLNPFVLYVEGATEKTILEEYIKHLHVRFSINNMQGINKAIYYDRVCRDSRIIEHFFIFDVHNIDEFNKYRDLYGDNCSFFFPDFVTENFSVEEVYNSLLDWINEIQLNIDEISLSEIREKLSEEKQLSIDMLNEFNENNEILIHNSLGFEKMICNKLRKKYSKEIVNLLPEKFRLTHHKYIENSRDFDDYVKTYLAHKLKKYVAESYPENGPRDKVFNFESKLKPFFTKIARIINSVH